MQGRMWSGLVPKVSLDDARAWFLGLGLGASEGVRGRAVARLLARVDGGAAAGAGDAGAGGARAGGADLTDSMTLALHAHCVADSVAGLTRHLAELKRNVGGLALALLINRPIHVPLANGVTLDLTAMTAGAMWERAPDKLRLLFAHGGRVDLPDAGGLYLEERLPLLPYVNHIVLYAGLGAGMSPIQLESGAGLGHEGRTARRRSSDCAAVCKEIRYLAGEEDPPNGWQKPIVVSHDLIAGRG